MQRLGVPAEHALADGTGTATMTFQLPPSGHTFVADAFAQLVGVNRAGTSWVIQVNGMTAGNPAGGSAAHFTSISVQPGDILTITAVGLQQGDRVTGVLYGGYGTEDEVINAGLTPSSSEETAAFATIASPPAPNATSRFRSTDGSVHTLIGPGTAGQQLYLWQLMIVPAGNTGPSNGRGTITDTLSGVDLLVCPARLNVPVVLDLFGVLDATITAATAQLLTVQNANGVDSYDYYATYTLI